jgi:RecA-family ATPase
MSKPKADGVKHIFDELGEQPAQRRTKDITMNETTSDADIFPPDRLTHGLRVVPGEKMGLAPESGRPVDEPRDETTPSLKWLDMSNWDNEPTPEIDWAIRDRAPRLQVGLFSGEGGTGKSTAALMRDVAHALGRDWMGSMPEEGPAFYLAAEDDQKIIHIRVKAIAKHYGVSVKDITDGGLHILPQLGEDATLCAPTRSGKIETTALYKQILEAAGDIEPINITVDTLTRAFAGNEIDRVQVYAFAMHMQKLAMVSNGTVTVLSHPSLQGMNSGSGISGSTAWHGAFRFRWYMSGVKADSGEQPDSDLRELQFKKNQYGPRGESIVLRYQRGLFLPEAGIAVSPEAPMPVLDQKGLPELVRGGGRCSQEMTVNPMQSAHDAPRCRAKYEANG